MSNVMQKKRNANELEFPEEASSHIPVFLTPDPASPAAVGAMRTDRILVPCAAAPGSPEGEWAGQGRSSGHPLGVGEQNNNSTATGKCICVVYCF